MPELSRILAEAFHDDPMMVWIVPDADDRPRRLAGLFSAVTRYHHLGGGGVEVAVDGDGRVGGVTLWDPPGRWKQSTWSMLRMGPAMWRALGSRMKAGSEAERALEAVHPEEPHWYLSAIGTGAAARGGGFGKALLTSRLDRCDREGVPAYLESSNVANLPYYERFGFELVREVAIPGGGPSFYPMWRNPR
ncbi:Acetyltransferase (GNAT) family protein [Rhodococcus triatomae]|uniref:Acetyltransferase (GNAT) family protein n=1 Tax=Rhodococcus triatomae TaxID=300028 RepID=A0A1G8DRE4_9NOCA|nr:Acetyltransferase (GNAT) family protein [Rhodococcus triatomae]